MSDAGGTAVAGTAAPGGQSAAQFGGQATGGAGCSFGPHAATTTTQNGMPVCRAHATIYALKQRKRKRTRKQDLEEHGPAWDRGSYDPWQG